MRFHAKCLSMEYGARTHVLTAYSLKMFIPTYMAYNFMLFVTMLNIAWGPTDFYAFS
jgi:hypothetical protein